MKRIQRLLQKIDEKISGIRLDFTLHFIVSAFIAEAVFAVAGLFGCDVVQSFLLAFLLTMTVGLLKETVIDAWLKGTEIDEQDVLADACGTCFALIAAIVNLLIF